METRHLIFGAFALFAAVQATAPAASDAKYYAFLEKFHPEHVKMVPRVIKKDKVTEYSIPKGTILVFKPSQWQAVLEAMKRELTPAKGYTPVKVSIGSDARWRFDHKRTKTGYLGLQFGAVDGTILALVRLPKGARVPAHFQPKPACTVETNYVDTSGPRSIYDRGG